MFFHLFLQKDHIQFHQVFDELIHAIANSIETQDTKQAIQKSVLLYFRLKAHIHFEEKLLNPHYEEVSTDVNLNGRLIHFQRDHHIILGKNKQLIEAFVLQDKTAQMYAIATLYETLQHHEAREKIYYYPILLQHLNEDHKSEILQAFKVHQHHVSDEFDYSILLELKLAHENFLAKQNYQFQTMDFSNFTIKLSQIIQQNLKLTKRLQFYTNYTKFIHLSQGLIKVYISKK